MAASYNLFTGLGSGSAFALVGQAVAVDFAGITKSAATGITIRIRSIDIAITVVVKTVAAAFFRSFCW